MKEKGYEVAVSPHDRVLAKDELIVFLKQDQYDAVLSLLTDKIDTDVLAAAGKQCKIFANYAVGFDNIDLKAAAERGVMITNTPGVLTDSVAEHAFTLLLAIAHRVAESDRFIRAGKYHGWEPMLLLGSDVSKKTLGILGLGRIGSRVATLALGLGMKVIANNRSPKTMEGVEMVSKEEVLKKADVVSVNVTSGADTENFISKRELDLMKSTAILINVDQSKQVDTEAIYQALKEKRIAG